MTFKTPDWVKHAVFYQIFPDRFARSSRTLLPKGITLKPWGSPPAEQGFQGGDLNGVADRLDYLHDLGVTALYLNPIFSSAANHRYHTYDYFQVDPLLGGNEALRQLLDRAHDRDMRVVLDGVFNHAGRGFWAFHHILENEYDSPYLDWFTVEGHPLRPYAADQDHPSNYRCWWALPALPCFNTDNPGVREYIFRVARHWLEFGIDGWRLDVPHEIDDDEFWREFRRTVKAVNPEAYICGEIWGPAQRWLRGDQFDAVMNYPFMSNTLSFCGRETLRRDYQKELLSLKPLTAESLAERMARLYARYDREVNLSLLNLLDSHDTARALWILGEDRSALRLAVLFQMTLPGAPCIYYGDEIGLSAGDDPDCREAFPWEDRERWDDELHRFYHRAIRLRLENPVLRTGAFENLFSKKAVYGFRRTLGDCEAVVVFNTSVQGEQITFDLALGPRAGFRQVWPESASVELRVESNRIQLDLPPREAVILTGNGA